jgi:hypothetical protein
MHLHRWGMWLQFVHLVTHVRFGPDNKETWRSENSVTRERRSCRVCGAMQEREVADYAIPGVPVEK